MTCFQYWLMWSTIVITAFYLMAAIRDILRR